MRSTLIFHERFTRIFQNVILSVEAGNLLWNDNYIPDKTSIVKFHLFDENLSSLTCSLCIEKPCVCPRPLPIDSYFFASNQFLLLRTPLQTHSLKSSIYPVLCLQLFCDSCSLRKHIIREKGKLKKKKIYSLEIFCEAPKRSHSMF